MITSSIKNPEGGNIPARAAGTHNPVCNVLPINGLGTAFHYPESVGKYKIIFQVPLILYLDQSGENIRHYVICHNPLILSVGLMGVVMVPITDINCPAGIDED